MHYGGLVGDHTTQSMVVELPEDGEMKIWITGTSLPCVSLFKPYAFGPDCVTTKDYWMRAERFRRNLLGYKLPKAYYEERDLIEKELISMNEMTSSENMPDLSKMALDKEKSFYSKWEGQKLESCKTSFVFKKNWKKKNMELD